MTTAHVVGRGVVARRVQRFLDLPVVTHHPHWSPISGLTAGDIVVLAHGGDQTEAAAELIEHGVHIIVMSDPDDDAGRLVGLGDRAAGHGTTIVAGAATAPGLSGLMARQAAGAMATVDEIHVALHGTAGPACARVHHRALRGPATAWHNSAWRDYVGGSGRELVWFPEPIGALDSYRTRSSEPMLLAKAFPGVHRISHRRTARRRDRLTARLPMLRPPHAEGGIGGLRIELRGAAADGSRVTYVQGIAEFLGTATAATAAAFVVELAEGGLAPGVAIPGDAALPTNRLLHRIARYGIRLQEFTGIPQP